jgi:Raf kinase inhibitor-like YbhB/YbcL family protein
MHLRSDSFNPYEFMDSRLALGRHDPAHHVVLAGNRNPHLAWDDVPPGTKSFALVCVDPDAPADPTNVNQEGKSVPVWLPRADFFHWVVCDIAPDLREIAEGSHSDGVTPKGKPYGPSASSGLQGINDYTAWFASDEAMSGDYGGYDGCGPPWNDERIHSYRFAVYALDVPTLGLSGRFTGRDLRKAIKGHVLATADLVGLYTTNPKVR